MSKQLRTAHILEEKWRSKDVRLEEKADFSSMLLSDKVLAGLEKNGFKIPSPIQIESIPVGRFGRDLVVQAKSGTGKTLVFTIIALEALIDIKYPQVMIVAPTREIATQICDVIKSVGCEFKNLKCNSFIGGIPVSIDAENCLGCQIVVGTPGRLRQLIDNGNLPVHSVRMLILDEADVLLEPSFNPDIDFIFMTLPKEKQVIATSATYPKELKHFIRLYFRDAFLARLNATELALLGIVHYIHQVETSKMPHLAYQLKIAALEKVLTAIQFTQCVVFCNMKTRVEPLCYDIRKWGFSTAFISSVKEQSDRLKAIDCLKKFRCKVLVSSDLTSRGIDAEKVDLIINFENPSYLETYMHRCGRAGRYGSKGVVISFLTIDEMETFEKIKKEGRFQAYSLPDPVPPNLISIRSRELDLSDNESSENEDSVDKSPSTSGRIQNREGLKETKNRLSLSPKKVLDSAENFVQKEERYDSTESKSNILEQKHILNNVAECDIESKHALKNSNGNETIQEPAVHSQILKNNTSISVESEKICKVSEKSNCVKGTEESVSDEILARILPNGTFDNDNAIVNHSYTSVATKESVLLNDIQLCKDENDANTCNIIQEVLHNESIRKDSNGVEVDNNLENCHLNISKEIKQLQAANRNCENENSNVNDNNDVEQDSSELIDNNLNSDIIPTTEDKLETSVSLPTNNNLGFQIQLNDIKINISKNQILGKIQLPIVRFLVDYDNNQRKTKAECDSNDTSFKVINILPSAPNSIKINQVKDVRENLSNFYQKIFKSYQSKFINEETYKELKLISHPQSFYTESGITYEKIVLHQAEVLDKPDDASSTSSGHSAYRILDGYMFQGKSSDATKNHKKGSQNISATSSSSSDSSSDSDSDDIEYYRELLHNKVKQQNVSSTAVCNAGKQSNNKSNYNCVKQQDVKENSSFEKLSCNKSNFEADDGRHGARRKTFLKNKRNYANNTRKTIGKYSSDSDDSYNPKFTEVPPAKNCVPHVKKTKVKSITNTVKDYKNVSDLKYTNNSSQPYYCPQNYQGAPIYVPQTSVTSQNPHCSRHRCHSTGSSFCFNGVCADWYGIFLKQWKYIQVSSLSGHQMPLNY